MMTKNFNRLGKPLQLEMVRRFGVQLMEFTRMKYMVRLFHLFNFYVEAFSLLETGEVVIINAFEDTTYLQPYLQEIDISGVC